MFYKQRREAEKQARMIERAAVESQIEEAFAEAEKIEDPAEKYLKLDEITRAITKDVFHENDLVYMAARAKEAKTAVTASLGGMALFFSGLGIGFVAPPVGIGMMISSAPTVMSGLPAGAISRNFLVKKRTAEAKDHFEKMAAFKQRTDAAKEALLKDHADQIAESPFYEQVLTLPGLAETFSGVAAKKLAQAKAQAAGHKSATEKKQKPTPQVGDYSKFKNPLGNK